MTEYGTQFLESEALFAIQDEDYATAKKHIENMTTRERRELIRACNNLSHLAGDCAIVAKEPEVHPGLTEGIAHVKQIDAQDRPLNR